MSISKRWVDPPPLERIAKQQTQHSTPRHDGRSTHAACTGHGHQALRAHRAIPPEQLNPRGGGLARGHPIGASGAVALVRLLANLSQDGPMGAQGLVAVAGAGGVGAAAVVARC